MNHIRRRRQRNHPVTTSKKVLTKKKGNVTGVCAGLGEYFGIDPILVRLAFVAGSFFSFGTAILLYLGLAVFLPSEDTDNMRINVQRKYEKTLHGNRIDPATRPDVSQSQSSPAQETLVVCWNCDTVSKPKSVYCHRCGAKL